MHRFTSFYYFFFFNDTATTEIYTLSLHDALPILPACAQAEAACTKGHDLKQPADYGDVLEEVNELVLVREIVVKDKRDRKSTRLNSSHANISYAVFCLKKKTKNNRLTTR